MLYVRLCAYICFMKTESTIQIQVTDLLPYKDITIGQPTTEVITGICGKYNRYHIQVPTNYANRLMKVGEQVEQSVNEGDINY